MKLDVKHRLKVCYITNSYISSFLSPLFSSLALVMLSEDEA